MVLFVKSSKLPTIKKFREQLQKRGVELEEWGTLDDTTNLADADICGCWPGIYKSQEIGFEFGIYSLEDEIEEYKDDFENFEEIIDGRNYIIDFTYRSEEEIFASMITICVLCNLSDAISFDDNDRLTINSETCEKWINDMI